MDSILYMKLSHEELRSCENCKYVLNEVVIPFKKVDSKGHPYEDIFNIIDSHYKDALQNTDAYKVIIKEAITEHLLYLRDHQEWFSGYITTGNCGMACQDYFAKDPFFKNRVAFMALLITDAAYADLFFYKRTIKKDIALLEAKLEK